MNIPKSDILNPESGDNAAVKLALAETHIIQETKSYLENQGVLLSSFSSRSRSETTILVKNIPYGTTADQVRELFEPHGELSRVLVPPAGTIAVVEFEKPDEAAKGFRAVAYRRLGNSIIYLEKGPLGMFIEGFVAAATLSTATPPAPTHAVRISEQVIDGAVAPATSEPALDKGTTLYIKNLAFSTTQERLHKVFAHLPGFSYARVQTKPDPKRPDARLSMGYGFMGFADVAGANAALKSVQGFVLDGHALHVSFAGRGADEPEKKKGVEAASRTTKMIVKNVPFEATRKDIRDLFGCAFSIVVAVIITHSMYSAVPMAISSPSVYPKNSTRVRAALPSSSSSLATKPRTRTQRCVTRICLAGISYSNGQRRLSRTSMCSARKLVSGTQTGQKICLGKNASSISGKT